MKPELQKQLDFVDWKHLDEEDIPKYIMMYTSDKRLVYLNACGYFDNRTTSKLVSPENYGPLSEILAKEGLVFAVPILVSLLSDPDIQSKRAIIDNLNEIASNIYHELANSIEPYHSRGTRIIASLKTALPIFRAMIDSTDKSTSEIAQEIVETLESLTT